MAVWPPSVNIKDDSSMQSLANMFRAGTRAGSDVLRQSAARLEPLIINTMQKYGLDGSNRLGFGSDAKKAASSVCDPMNKAADHMVDAGELVGFAFLAFVKNVWTPIAIAKQEQKTGSRETLNI